MDPLGNTINELFHTVLVDVAIEHIIAELAKNRVVQINEAKVAYLLLDQ